MHKAFLRVWLACLVVVVGVLFYFPGTLVQAEVSLPVAKPLAVPSSISIPKINKLISVIPVGVTKAGALDVPHNFIQAGWYDRGPVPGGAGSAVIDGHVDNGGAIPGVFKNLHTLTAGDDIYVTGANGAVSHFKVTSLAVYNRNAFPSQQIFADGNKSLLKIITCYGTFLPKADTYDRRLVVTATLVG